MIWNAIFTIMLVIIVVSLICIIMLENRNPHKAVGWILVLVMLPGLGIILYFLFGRDKRQVRKINRHTSSRFNLSDTPDLPYDEAYHNPVVVRNQLLQNMVYDETLGNLLKADEVAIFTEGKDKMEALLADIDNAREFIHIEYYRVLSDHTGAALAEALIKKAKEGVKVRLICDYVGSFMTSSSYFNRLSKSGVEVRLFLKVFFPSLRSDINYRNHRKIVVIDRNIGYVGGMNIGDHYTIGSSTRQPWRDAHFRVTGWAVNGLQSAFISDWHVASKIILSDLYYLNPMLPLPPSIPNTSGAYLRAPKVKNVPMQTFTSGPTSRFRTLLQAWSRSIYEARHHIYIETPYFLPTESLNKALIGAALSGVEVTIVLPMDNDSLPVKYASESYYEELLEAGVNIYHYKGQFNHSKILTVDGEVSFIGSANMDFRSLEHNFEITSILYDEAFTHEVEALIEDNISQNCYKLTLSEWGERKIWLKLSQSFFRLFSPLM